MFIFFSPLSRSTARYTLPLLSTVIPSESGPIAFGLLASFINLTAFPLLSNPGANITWSFTTLKITNLPSLLFTPYIQPSWLSSPDRSFKSKIDVSSNTFTSSIPGQFIVSTFISFSVCSCIALDLPFVALPSTKSPLPSGILA